MIFLLLFVFSLTAHAEDKTEATKEPPEFTPATSVCIGNYTMYTHPDEHCKKILAEEYKAMVKQYLETARKSSTDREE